MKFICKGLLGFAVLSGCATVDDLTLPKMNEDVVYAADVLYSFECELAEALKQPVGFKEKKRKSIFENKAIRVAFVLKGTASKGGKSNIKLGFPSGLAAVTVNTTLTPTAKATRKIEFRVNYDTNKLQECERPEVGEMELTRIAAGLGLAEWANEAAILEDKLGKKIEISNYTVEFDIGNSVSASSSVARTLSEGNTREFGFVPTGSNGAFHQIVVTMKDFDAVAEKPKKETARSVQLPTVVFPQSIENELDRILDRVLDGNAL